MDKSLGWVKLYRNLEKQPWYGKPNTVALFIHLLIKCTRNTDGHSIFYKGKEVKLLPGQYWTTHRRLMKEIGVTHRNLRTSFEILKTTHTLTHETSTQGTIITVNNWDKFQSQTHKGTHDRHTTDTRGDTKTRSNNIRNKEEEKIYAHSAHAPVDYFNQFWKEYPVQVDKARCLKIWNKQGLDSQIQKILEALSVEKQSSRWTKDNGEYIPDPKTWLSNSRWESSRKVSNVKPLTMAERVRALAKKEGKDL
jgi:hypothetical protein